MPLSEGLYPKLPPLSLKLFPLTFPLLSAGEKWEKFCSDVEHFLCSPVLVGVSTSYQQFIFLTLVDTHIEPTFFTSLKTIILIH